MIVVDASLMVAWLLQEDELRVVPELYDSLPERAVLVPSHWPVELANALLINCRRGRISRETLASVLDDLSLFRVSIDAALPIDQIEIVTQFAAAQRLSVYDASYVYLALEEGVPLATIDRDIRAAARTLDIELIPRD